MWLSFTLSNIDTAGGVVRTAMNQVYALSGSALYALNTNEYDIVRMLRRAAAKRHRRYIAI
ncbi:hypothetical protein IQ256_29175 [cf. Phormidesmis sp. LEGE 11477]|nr:hypothetical protein [cf. Phormidesmis sp. LEGE 11477]